MLPAYVANMTPVFARIIFPHWKSPIDFNKKIGGKRILGSHKTWRGLVCGTIAGIIIAYLQYLISPTPFDRLDY
ncbi:CDP-archaeol synthase, partial [Candidatus Woesearchaeota archaeon]